MNGDYFEGIDVVGDVLNQPGLQENYPMDFTGYNFPEPGFDIETATYTPPPEPFDIQTAAYTPPPAPLRQEPSSQNEMVNFFGKVLDVAGKTYQQVAIKKEVQNLKSTPYVTSALNALGYPTVRKAQTGMDTGILTSPLSSIGKAVSSMSPMILILGVGVLVFVVMRKK